MYICIIKIYSPFENITEHKLKFVQVVIIVFLTLSRKPLRRKNYNLSSQMRRQKKGRSFIQQMKNINHVYSVVGNIPADFHTECKEA